MDIKINETGIVQATIVCIYKTQKNDLKNKILGVLYFDNKNGERFDTTENFYKKLNEKKILAWSGRYDNKTKSFVNVSMVYPCIDSDKKPYLRTAEDNTTKNNLLELPDYTPKTKVEHS